MSTHICIYTLMYINTNVASVAKSSCVFIDLCLIPDTEERPDRRITELEIFRCAIV